MKTKETNPNRPRSPTPCKQGLSPCSPLAEAGGGGGFFWVGKQVELWEMGKWRTGINSISAFVSFFSAMHRNNLSDFIYISVSIFRKFRPSRKYRVSNIDKNLLSVLKR